MFEFLKQLSPNQAFIRQFKYVDPFTMKIVKTEFMLMRRTKERKLNLITGKYEYIDGNMTLNNIENFYENYISLNSSKCYSSLEDPELNMLTAIRFGKSAKDLPLF